MLKILIVSISSPPKSDPESIQVGRYIKYLNRLGCHIELITSRNPTLYMEVDNSLNEYNEGVSRIHKVKLLENRYLNFILRKINPSLLQYPDSKWSFFINKIPKCKKPDILYSRSYPISSTLMALKIKKRWKDVPWVLHLSDPWAISYKGPSPATNFGTRPRSWNNLKERECFSLASRISMTSEKTIALYVSKFPEFADKFILTPNVFDDEKTNNHQVNFTNMLNIVYTGGFGEKRHPDFLLQNIEVFLENVPGAKDCVNFIFSGPLTRENTSKFQSFSHVPQIQHVGVIPYDQMIKLQWDAHILVNIDTNIADHKHTVFFPSKLLEYFAAKRRILAIGNRHSVTFDAVGHSFGDCIEFDDDKKLQKQLKTYFEKYREEDRAFFELRNNIDHFGAGYNAKNLKQEFEQIVVPEAR